MIQALIILVAVAFGYYLGNKRYVEDTKIAQKVAGKAQAIITGEKSLSVPSGIIYRPTAKRLNELKHKANEGEQAMVETLDNIPAIKEAKRELEKGVNSWEEVYQVKARQDKENEKEPIITDFRAQVSKVTDTVLNRGIVDAILKKIKDRLNETS